MRSVIIMLAVMLMFPAVLYSAEDGEKGASRQAHEHASDQAIFNRVGDWFATVGKSDEEKEAIKAERLQGRERKRLEKEEKKKIEESEYAGETAEKKVREQKEKTKRYKKQERIENTERTKRNAMSGTGRQGRKGKGK